MASEKQIEANRLNALKSTGPRTEEGKAASRCNALKTGIDAEMTALDSEDPEAFAALVRNFHDQYQPANHVECALVDALADSEWRIRRFRRIEAQLFFMETRRDYIANQGGGNDCDAFANKLETFTRIYRRQDIAHRNFHRALAELERVQARRTSSPLPANAPDDPPGIGFVPQTNSESQPDPRPSN